MLRSLTLICALGLAPLAASAETVISLSLSPRNDRQAEALRLVIALYAISREIRSGAGIEQIGQGNAAEIVQSGGGSFGLIRQRGRDHSATLTQTGQGQAYAIIQSGKGTVAQVTDPDSGILLQYGW